MKHGQLLRSFFRAIEDGDCDARTQLLRHDEPPHEPLLLHDLIRDRDQRDRDAPAEHTSTPDEQRSAHRAIAFPRSHRRATHVFSGRGNGLSATAGAAVASDHLIFVTDPGNGRLRTANELGHRCATTPLLRRMTASATHRNGSAAILGNPTPCPRDGRPMVEH